MNEETFNLGIRRFLKEFGVGAQRGVEKAVAAAIASHRLNGNETIKVRAVIDIEGLGNAHALDGQIALE
jgi:hypothetical protein